MTFRFSTIFAILFCLSNLIKADFILINNDALVPISVWGAWQNKAKVKLLNREISPGMGMANISMANSGTNNPTHIWIIPNFGISGGSVFPMPKSNDCVFSFPTQDCSVDHYLQSMSFGTNTQKLQPESWCYTPANIPSSLKITPNWFIEKRDLANTVVNSFVNVGEVFDINYSPLATSGAEKNSNYNPQASVFTGENRTVKGKLSYGDQTTITGANFANKPLNNLMQYENVRIKTFNNCTFDGADMRGLFLDNKTFIDCSFKNTKLGGTSLNNTQFYISRYGEKTNIDFSGADLTGAFLVGVKMSNIKFSGAKLDNVYCYSAKIQDSDFTGINSWRGADFTGGANLSTCTFNNVDFSGVKYDKTTLFQNTHMSKAIFKGTAGKNTDLSNINFQGSDFTGAKLGYTILNKTNMSSAKLDGADLTGANLSGANFSNSSMIHTAFTSGQFKSNTNCSGVIFSTSKKDKIDLTGFNFSGANLQNAKFVGATLKGANFSNANVMGADFSSILGTASKADTNKITFDGAQVHSASFYKAHLENAIMTNISCYKWKNRRASTGFTHSYLNSADFKGADVSVADFTSANLSHAKMNNIKNISGAGPTKFSFANMTSANLSGSKMSESRVHFNNANMTNTNMSSVNLNKAYFSGATLANTNFSHSKLGAASFEGIYNNDATTVNFNNTDLSIVNLKNLKFDGNKNIKYATFQDSRLLVGASFKNTNLSNSKFEGLGMISVPLNLDFSGSNLHKTSFKSAVLNGANFQNVTAHSADFSGAYCEKCKFNGAKLGDSSKGGDKGTFKGAYLKNASFGRDGSIPAADLNHADFSGARMVYVKMNSVHAKGINLTNANLASAILTRSNLIKAKLSGAYFGNADLRYCNFDKAKGMSSANFEDAYYFLTKWDDGKILSFSQITGKKHGKHLSTMHNSNTYVKHYFIQ